MSDASGNQFGRVRSILWPIHNYELKKLLPMLLMFFCICLNYSLLRNLKDTLVVHGDKVVGAQVIPYLKFWGVMPFAILAVILYSKMSNTFSKRVLFILTVLPFIIFFSLFAWVLYPNCEYLHYKDLNLNYLPAGISVMLGNWTFSLFFIFAELWGSVIMSLLFWGLANEITSIAESKRFYGLFGIGANVALLFSGRITQYLANENARRLGGELDVSQIIFAVQSITKIFLISAFGVLFFHWIVNTFVMTDPRLYKGAGIPKKKKPKLKLSESFAILSKSKHLLYIAILVISYGVSINLIEVTWKGMLKEYYHGSTEYLNFMGRFNTYTAVATIFFMLFCTGNILRIFGWKITALITPVVSLIGAIAFFALAIFRNDLVSIFTGVNVLFWIVTIGTAQNVLCKSSKYALFDPTKEMVYIPLDDETKVKGKAAVDVVAARFGKAGGSLIQQIIYVLVAALGLSSPIPIVGVIVIGVILSWINSVNKLSIYFAKSVKNSGELDGEQQKDKATV